MMRVLALAGYGSVCYAASMVSLVVLFSWLGGFGFFPIRLDEEGGSFSLGAFAWNTTIMIAFALYHSVFARTGVKQRTRALLGRNLERASYNLVSAVLAVLLCLAWRPIPIRLWELPSPEAAYAMHAAYGALWVVHMTSIVLMNHNDFFGLRQIGLAMRGEAYRPLPPVSRGYYLSTRLALVISLALIPWASPVMTAGRLQLCVFMTIYTALGAWLSNRDRGDLMTIPAPGFSQSTSEPMIGKANPV
jgi:methanethiol S-methyltransferase